MTARAQKIEREARMLPPAERERLAQVLMTDLRSEVLSEVDEAWVREAEKRYRKWKKGLSQAEPAEKVLRDLRREISR